MTQSKVAGPLRIRWLGRVPYREALAVQTALFKHGTEKHLLLLEHTHVFTYGARTDLAANLRCDPAAVGADLVAVNRGGDVTYHGPGQLVGYPILSVDNALGAADHVRGVEHLLIDALPAVARWTPWGATSGLLQLGPAGISDGTLLAAPSGGLLLVGYTTVAMAPALVIVRRRDVL